VSHYKFTILKIISRKIFGEFREFFPIGLNPFKIQASSKFDLFPGFLIQNPKGFWSWAKNESCPVWSKLSPCKVWTFLEPKKDCFCNLQVVLSLEIEKK
jgi:hypothetical protein